jgi:uncharacterized membrane protein YkoI
MNTAKLRSKRVIVTTLAAVTAVAAVSVGGLLWTSAANADVPSGDRDRVAAAAVKAVGSGTAVDVETSDDAGQAYEVEVRKDDGTEVDVALDQNLNVVTQAADTDTDNDADTGTDADDRVLSDTERASAEKAALAAITGGTVLGAEAGDDGDAAFEVEVRDPANAEWDVELDAAFKVLTKTADN